VARERKMADYSQKVAGSFNERMRLNRVRRRKVKQRFWEEFRIIPRWLVGLVVVLFFIAQGVALLVNLTAPERGDQIFPPELGEHGHVILASLALAGIITLVSILFAGFIFLTAYVNRDASRRGMNAALWTILILIFFPTWGLIGFVIYFLIREPLPYPCPQCGASVSARFNFCPNCKCNLQPSCQQCKREVAELDKFCPYCGNDLASPQPPNP